MLFVKAYYEYMEQEGKTQYELNNIKGYKDIDLTLDSYIDYFRKTVLPSIPLDVLADKRLLVKTIRDFYQSKGTIDSYRFLFRALYNEDIEINYPADKMLVVSGSDLIDILLFHQKNRHIRLLVEQYREWKLLLKPLSKGLFAEVLMVET